MPPDKLLIKKHAAVLNAEINGVYGLYLDAMAGFSALLEMIEKSQQEADVTDDSPFFYGRGTPGTPENVLQHQTTPGILKTRIRKGGGNYFRLGRLLLVMLYELWETGYRTRLAAAAGVSREDVLVPIFGDLRLLRNAILHNKSRLAPETVAKLAVVGGLDSTTVDLQEDDVEKIVRAAKAGVDELVRSWTGDDPGYRTRMRVE